MKVTVFWVVAQCSLVEIDHVSEALTAFVIIDLMTEALSISETSVNFYQTTWRNNPKDSHLHTRRRGNLKSHGINLVTKINL
jgi:hypothetical protein